MKPYMFFLTNSFKEDKNKVAFITLTLFVLKAIFTVYNATGPAILNDEYIYKFNAESIFHLQKYADAHYPPAYSIALAPALFFDRWYEAMLVINAFISSMTVPAAWLLARAAGVRHPLVPAALAAIIPFHAVYPSFLLSENLFVPAFCLALALALRGASASAREGVLFGLVLGLAHMTKYMFLPAAPLLYLGWLWGMRRPENGRSNPWAKALAPVAGYALVVSLWLWYGHSSGFLVRELLGLDISAAGRLVTNAGETARRIRQFASAGSLFMWVCAYAAFFFLIWLPVWGIGMIWAAEKFSGRLLAKHERQVSLFLVLSLALIMGFCLTAMLHSFGGMYNYPHPKRIMARYLVHLGPVMLVIAAMALEALHGEKASGGRNRTPLCMVGLTALLGIIALWVIRGGIWDFPSFFYKNQVNLLNLSSIGPAAYLFLALVPVTLYAAAFRESKHPAMVSVPLAAFLLCSSIAYACSAPYRQEGLHMRMIVAASTAKPFKGKSVHVFIGKTPVPAKGFADSARFWDLRDTTLTRIQDRADLPQLDAGTFPAVLLSPDRLDLPALVRYSFKKREFTIYRLEHPDELVSVRSANRGAEDEDTDSD
jgi:hypothetical protein